MYGNQQKYQSIPGNTSALGLQGNQPFEPRVVSGPPDKSEIEHEMNVLTEAVSVLHNELDMLGVKLNPVIPPVPIGGQTGDSAPDPVRSPLGQSIHDRSTDVGHAIYRIKALRESIAL